MNQKKVVAHYQNGKVFKGTTKDFFPSQDFFHLTPMDAPKETKPLKLSVYGMKGLFFVKNLLGNKDYYEKKDFNSARPVVGHKIRIIFKDGELMVGTTNGYQEDLSGLIVVPADSNSNNERCFVFTSAIQKIASI